MKPSAGAAARDHRNAVRDRSESLSAFNRNRCPQSSESAPNVGRSEPPAIWIKSSIPVLNAAILILSVHFPLRPPQFSCLKAGHGHGPRRPAEALRPALSDPPADAL